MRSLQQIRHYYQYDELPNYNFTVLNTHFPCLITSSKVANLFSCQKKPYNICINSDSTKKTICFMLSLVL